MSKSLSSAASKMFDSEVLHEYQQGGLLVNTVTRRTNVVGDQYNFRLMGKGLANARGAPQTDVVPMDTTHTKTPVTLQNWVAPEYTDIFDEFTVNFQERAELAMTIAQALGRRDDQLIIDALDAISTYAGTVDTNVGGTSTDVNPAKLRRASRLLNDKGVPMSGRHFLLSAIGLEALLGNTEATSADFNTVRALVNGDINKFVGFAFHIVEDRSSFEGGLTITGSVRDGYAYHESAIGHASAFDPNTRVDWVGSKQSWLSVGRLKAGAVDRNGLGVAKVQSTES